MPRAAVLNLKIAPGRFFKKRMKAPFNCTGYEAYASCCNAETGVKIFDFAIQWIDRAEGWFYLIADKTVTPLLPRNAVWDLLMVPPNGESFDMLEGNIKLDSVCTQEPGL